MRALDPKPGTPVDQGRLLQSIERHNFEAVAKRARGEEDPTIRTGYVNRKGISSDRRDVFDGETKQEFKTLLGKCLIAIGYEQDDNW